ncbi:MAG: hypothetical protein DMG97_01035 [Acidobacteria bacterium]|nr:MAG: hypothetical protein DMG98_15925 [Acidobacteriota bacterium]PYV72954.1 MAG: hypothetical protein DMG96_24565 [Acidobacteriota bacterium]PYV77765.1 MAG: hypothetical protein DMG97_01035 [Acidobacteriota bacterium]
MKAATLKLVDPTSAEIDFLRSELSTGLTLTGIALDSRDQARRNRNCANARKAYDAVKRFVPRVALSPDETNEINSRLEHLRSELQRLGEEV